MKLPAISTAPREEKGWATPWIAVAFFAVCIAIGYAVI